MFDCCSSIKNETKITDRIKSCPIHDKQMLFVCKNTDTCINKSLFCTGCADEHRGHDFETVSDFFTPELNRLITQQTSWKGEKI